jgi:hypothetical protein
MHLLSEQVLGGVTYREGQKVVLASSFLEKEALHWHVLYFIQAVHPEQTRHVNAFEYWAALLYKKAQKAIRDRPEPTQLYLLRDKEKKQDH